MLGIAQDCAQFMFIYFNKIEKMIPLVSHVSLRHGSSPVAHQKKKKKDNSRQYFSFKHEKYRYVPCELSYSCLKKTQIWSVSFFFPFMVENDTLHFYINGKK